jgi:hypothetical protein
MIYNSPCHFKGATPAAPGVIAPITKTNTDVVKSQYDAMLSAKKRKGLASTIFAGDSETQNAQGVAIKSILGQG